MYSKYNLLKSKCAVTNEHFKSKDGVPEEKACPEGLFFNDKAQWFSYPCSYPVDVECGARTKLQTAQPTEECPHQFGYYKIGDRANCGQWMNCVNGKSFVFDCPEGLAWSGDTYRCDWPDEVEDCDAEGMFLVFAKVLFTYRY